MLEAQYERDKKAGEQLQTILDEAGVSAGTLLELANVDVGAIDPAFLQEVELSAGMKINELPSTKLEPNASNFRQRTRALAV